MTKEQAIKVIENIKEIPHIDNMVNRNTDEALSVAINSLKSEPKHGEWVAYEFGNERWHKCSVCGKADEYINNLGLEAIRNYCPNCGADMREVE